MSNPKKNSGFRNPLLHPSEEQTDPLASLTTPQQISPSEAAVPRRQGEFEASHERLTTWVDAELKARFEAYCRLKGRGSKTSLMNEALSDLLKKHKVK